MNSADIIAIISSTISCLGNNITMTLIEKNKKYKSVPIAVILVLNFVLAIVAFFISSTIPFVCYISIVLNFWLLLFSTLESWQDQLTMLSFMILVACWLASCI